MLPCLLVHGIKLNARASVPLFFQLCPGASFLQAYQAPPVDPCDMDKQNFGQCLQNNNNDVTACQFVFEALQTCQLEAKKTYN